MHPYGRAFIHQRILTEHLLCARCCSAHLASVYSSEQAAIGLYLQKVNKPFTLRHWEEGQLAVCLPQDPFESRVLVIFISEAWHLAPGPQYQSFNEHERVDE